MKHIASLTVLLLAAGGAAAKLPALSDEAKAKAAETTARTAWTNKVADYKLCQSMDKVAAAYQANAKKDGKPAPAPVATPPCSDPGPFSYVPPTEAKPPIEQAGAHSPPRTAAQPHNSTTPDAAQNPAKK